MRSGLISDVQLYEEYPSRYSADVSRRRRWIRGDWQILRWLFPGVPGLTRASRRTRSPLVPLEDFRQPSAQPLAFGVDALLLLRMDGVAVAVVMDVSVIGVVLIPSLMNVLMEIFQKPGDVLLGQHLAGAAGSIGRSLAQVSSCCFACLMRHFSAWMPFCGQPGGCWSQIRVLLEWNPSGDSDRTSRTDLAGSFRTMWFAPVIATAAACWIALSGLAVQAVAMPILILWFVSPLITWWISKPLSQRRAKLTDGQSFFLRKISRKTWSFFETFVGPDGQLAAA